MEIILMIKVKESDYDLTLKKLYEEHKLLVSSLFEIFGDEIKSASLFCLENGISIRERDKIILLLIKFSANHSIYELDFWKDTLITGIPILSELDDKEFQKMLILPIMSSPKSLNFRLFFKFLPRKTEQKMYDSHCILY